MIISRALYQLCPHLFRFICHIVLRKPFDASNLRIFLILRRRLRYGDAFLVSMAHVLDL